MQLTLPALAAWALACLVPAAALAQPTTQELTADPALFLRTARTALKWDEPADPAPVLGPIHFVGTTGLGAYLITGSEGHVLVYTGMPGSGPLIEKAIARLGFRPKDVKVILTGHAHVDHVGGHAYLKTATGARIAMMREEVALFESGGKTDFHYAAVTAFAFDPAKVAMVVRDGDEVRVGDITVTALLTPGHTRGSTTYVTTVVAGGRRYAVVFPDGTGVNPGYRVARNPSYPGIGADYRRTFRTLESLQPDVWLAPHNEACDFAGKLARARTDGARAWVDPDGYRKWVAAKKAGFEAASRAEQAAPDGTGPSPPGSQPEARSTGSCRASCPLHD